jgi:hypothetical protein
VANNLPIVGSDNNTWGGILNTFLLQSLIDTSLYTYTPNNGSGTLNIASTNPATGGGTNFNLSTTSYPGLVQLAGDLGGSGTSATSPTLTSIITAGTVGSSSQIPVITYNAKGLITSVTTASASGSVQRTFAFFAG